MMNRAVSKNLAIACLLLLAVAGATACKEENELYRYEADEATGETTPATPPPRLVTNAPVAAMPDELAAPADRERLGEDVPLQTITVARVKVSVPAKWIVEEPASRMRAAQLAIPPVEGERRGAELVVFHFGLGQGGGARDNIDRWIGQVELNSGTEPVIYSQETDGLRVTEVLAEGTLKPSTMGTGPTEPQPDSGLHGLVIEGGPLGTLFVKITGGAGTVRAVEPAIVTLIDSLEVDTE